MTEYPFYRWARKMATCFFYHKMLYYPHSGDIAHLVERLVRNQQVVGSSPIISIKLMLSYQREFFLFLKH